jgi:hypothetical protein
VVFDNLPQKLIDEAVKTITWGMKACIEPLKIVRTFAVKVSRYPLHHLKDFRVPGQTSAITFKSQKCMVVKTRLTLPNFDAVNFYSPQKYTSIII